MRMSGTLTGLVNIEDPPRESGKPLLQTNGAHGPLDPEVTNGL